MKFLNQAWIVLVILAVVLLNVTPRTSASAANESVQVWLTLADGSKKLLQESDLNFSAGSGSGTVITVDPATLYQKFEGAGAAMTDSSAWLIANKLDNTQRAALMNNLFTRTGNGVGLSYLRVPMGASDFALNSYTYDDMPAGQTDPTLANFSISHDNAYIIPGLQAALALNPNLRLMGTPWSAPAWMKDNENLNAGALLPAYKQAFADYHVKFVQAYAAAGLPIDAITPQNEPMNATASYPSMGMSAAEQRDFIKNNLGPAFATAGLGTKILALDHNWDLVNYPLTILNDEAAAAYVDGTAFHCYAGTVGNQSTVHTAYPNKGIWFTECSGGAWSTDFGDNMSWNMKNLVVGNFRNWGKSLLLWNLALDETAGPTNGGCANCRGVVTIDSATGNVTYNEEYYILGHVTKFVDPGAYRAESTAYADGQPENVAFLNPDGSLSLIVHSTAASTFDVEWNGQHFSYSLPAKGTVTFKWDSGSTPGATATSAPTATAAPTAAPYPAGPLQPFEAEGTYYTDYQATTSLSTEQVHGGTSALKSFSSTGEWHTVGAYLNDHPINATGLGRICLWVYDTTAADNSMGFRLVDGTGASQEIWSDNPIIGTNPKTVANTWVQMCFKLSAYTLVDLTKLDKVQMAMYWAGTYYFDDITGLGPDPTPTPTEIGAPTATATPTLIKVATIGDSITFGAGTSSPNLYSYPAQLQGLLGSAYNVGNYGHSGATMLKQADTPYWDTSEYASSKAFQPDIVVIMLGTNDSKSWNWQYKSAYISNYEEMIAVYRALDSHPTVYINMPPPAFSAIYGIDGAVIEDEIIPMINQISTDTGAPIIDIHTSLVNSSSLFPDGVHPNNAGASQVAQLVYSGITGNPAPTPTATGTPAPTGTPYPAGMLQPFENEGTYYTDYQAVTSLSTEAVHGGTKALKSFSDTGAWHTVGAYLNDRPINATGLDRICLWVYDTTAADNSLGFKIFDASGASQEFWSDDTAIGTNSKTVQNTWVQMCFKLSAYNSIDLAALDKVQIAVYWAGTYYFDDITGVAADPTPTVTPTLELTATPTVTATITATPFPAGALQPFETEGTYYNDYQVTPSLSTSVVHGGNSSLLSFSDTGAWHTVGAYFDNRPINATGYEKICFWVNDTTAADNDLAFKLFDATGANQEFWSSNPAIGSNAKTVSNTWVQMCFNLSAYTGINLAQLDKMQIAVYWAGAYYFDDVTGVAPQPATATATPAATETATATATATLPVTETATTAVATPTATPTVTMTPTQTPTRTNTPGAVTLTFTSNGAQDGWVRESSENSNVGGALDVSSSTLRLGDDAFNRQYRAILSFNTASLPDGAQITSAVLKLRKIGTFVGGNPFTALGRLWADIRQGAFGGNPALALNDFNAPASARRVGAFSSTPVSGWYIDMLNATGRSKVNKTGLTQLRLYFATGDNNNNAATLVNLLSGNNAANKPVLVITYTLP